MRTTSRSYLAVVAFLAAEVTSSVAFFSLRQWLLRLLLCQQHHQFNSFSLNFFLAISANAAMFSAATSAVADAKSVIALA